jgi:hypothetical protein
MKRRTLKAVRPEEYDKIKELGLAMKMIWVEKPFSKLKF